MRTGLLTSSRNQYAPNTGKDIRFFRKRNPAEKAGVAPIVRRDQKTLFNASLTTLAVSSMSVLVWASDRNPASNCDGAK